MALMSAAAAEFRIRIFLIALGSLLAAQPVRAVDWAQNDVRFLSGAGFELGSNRRSHLAWQHLSAWKYGDSYFFYDLIRRADLGAEHYGEFYTWLSTVKLLGRERGWGFIRDVEPGMGFNLGGEPFTDRFKAYLVGGKIVLGVPGFRYLAVESYAYQADSRKTGGLQLTPVWDLPFTLGRTRVIFRGFFDYRNRGASGGAFEIFGQPELMIDIGHYWGQADKVLIGLRWQYVRNKFGIRGVDEDAQQVMLSYTF